MRQLNSKTHMKLLTLLALILFLTGCGNEKTISFNPFEPNTDLKTKTALKNGFTLKWACDGGYNTYFLTIDNYEMNLYEDCTKPGVIIGETHIFSLPYGANCWEYGDSLQIDIDEFRNEIKSIISRFNGTLLDTVTVLRDGSLILNALNKEKEVFETRISCYPNGELYLTFENWNKK